MRALVIVISLPALFFCREDTQLRPCDPESGRFVGEKHYIKSDFLNEDKKWDYTKWDEYRRSRSDLEPAYDCIPIKRHKQLNERIDEKEAVIDIMR